MQLGIGFLNGLLKRFGFLKRLLKGFPTLQTETGEIEEMVRM